MAKVQITLSFMDQPLAAVPRFAPGNIVRGNVQVTSEQNVQCHHLYVKLQWATNGKGDRDHAVVAQQDIFQGMLQAGLPFSYAFTFPLPQAPWSYTGFYINIAWEVQVEADLGLFNKPKQQIPLIMALSSVPSVKAIEWA